MNSPGDPFRIELKKHRVIKDANGAVLEVPVDVYAVELIAKDEKKGVWPETYGSKSELQAFLRGVRAGASMCGFIIFEPEVP